MLGEWSAEGPSGGAKAPARRKCIGREYSLKQESTP